MHEFPFQPGDNILVRTQAFTGEQVILGVAVEFEDGSHDIIQIDSNPAGTGAVELFRSDPEFKSKGRVLGLSADVKGANFHEGLYWMEVFIRRGNDTNVFAIAAFNVTSDFFGGLGYFEPQAWALWVYRASIVNGAGGGGTVSWTITPGAGVEMEILGGFLQNLDTSTRTGSITIRDDDDNDIAHAIRALGIGAGSRSSYPSSPAQGSDLPVAAGPPSIVRGAMDIFASIAAVAASQDGLLTMIARIRGGLPTVTEAGNSTPTITIDKEAVF